MKITKKLEAEISTFLDSYWHNYFEGNLDKWSSYIPDDYRNIGTTNEELWSSKKDILDYTNSVLDQMVGKADFRNKKVELISYSPYIMAHELGDLYVKNEENWVFYAPFRLSSILGKTDNGWQVLHQHGSYPDSRTVEGEAFSLDALKAENQKLLEAVAQRTEELENKNKELAIEAALERVRAVAMGMQEPADLLKICRVLYDELESLGFVELRNTMVNLNNDEASLLHNYDYSGNSGGEVTMIPYDSHPSTRNIVNKLRKSSNAFGQFAVTGKKLEEWRDYRKGLGEKDDPKLKSTKKLSYYFYSVGTASIGISTYKPISKELLALLERFRNVFELAYRRYSDIKQAEEQAHEAKIEAALEKVRARTMAMQHSSELPEAANLLFLEVQALGIPAWSCGYNILNEDKKSVMCWMSSEGQIQSGFHLPFTNTGEKSFPQWEKALKDQVPFLVQELGGKDIEDHYDYMRTLPELEPVLEELDAAGLALPTYQINHLSFFNGGFLLFITYEHVPEAHDLFKRFTKVFEQTFTRFLDLQKAEEQAREAQIEAALERVRASSMAMHKTQDIADVVVVFFEQLKLLEVQFVQSWINVLHPEEGLIDIWLSPLEGIYDEPAFFKIPMALFENTTVKSWKAGETFSYVSFKSKKELNALFKACDQATNSNYFGHLQKKLQLERLEFLDANYKYGAVSKSGIDKATSEEEEILHRFAKVFEQTYTRFLDLQKAEAQAKEAQIEAALEKVRSRSLAMQKSEELADLSLELVKQVQALGETTWFCAFNIYGDDPRGSLEWGSNGEGTFPKYRTPREGVFLRYYNAGQQGETILINEIGPEECPAHYDYLCSLPGVGDQLLKMKDNGIPFPASQIDHVAFFKHGYVLFITYDPVPELHDVFIRFAKVFEQSYTRFLDLQKAEAQAREAQIEASLERVRAASMAMHASDELKEVVRVIFDQLASLDINAEHAGIVVDYQPKRDWHFWIAETQDIPAKVSVPYLNNVWDRQFTKAKKNGEDFFTTLLNFDQKNRFYAKLLPHVKGLTRKAKNFYLKCPGLAISTSIQEDVALYIENFAGTPYTDEENAILKRFTKVFQQTYTRFLDLQKAEAQAREAQIEAALEKVRGRSMAMQRSDDLTDVLTVVFEQLESLGIGSEWTHLTLIDLEANTFTYRMTTREGKRVFADQVIDLNASDIWKDSVKTFRSESPETISRLHFPPASLSSIWDIFDEIFSSLEGDDDFHPDDFTDGIFTIEANCKFGYLGINRKSPASEEDEQILARFAKEFGMVYQRFLDIQKAEAQAREAQIEAALERVRAQTMAMHSSEDIGRSTLKMFDELTSLGVDQGTRFGIGILNHANEYSQLWTATKAGDDVTMHIGNLDMNSHALLKSARKAWIKQHPLNIYVLEGKDLQNYYQILSNAPEYKIPIAIENLPDREIHYGFVFDHGFFYAFTPKELEPELIRIIQRFSSVFGQTYRRYLDLVTAEEQAKEAQIEAALERVRSRTMAMHSSDELAETASVLFQQLRELGLAHERTNIGVVDEENDKIDFWVTTQTGELVDKPFPARIDESKTTATIYKGYKSNKKSIVIDLKGTELKQWITYITKTLSIPYNAPSRDDRRIQSVGYFSRGMLIATSIEPLDTEELQILERFAAVFDQTYTRFLDLQKAEAQVREAQIEAALERVRARSLAMHKSDELWDVVNVVSNQFEFLDIITDNCFINIFEENSKDFNIWIAAEGQTYPELVRIPYTNNPAMSRLATARRKKEEFYVQNLNQKTKNEFFNHFFNSAKNIKVPKKRQKLVLDGPGFTGSVALSLHASITISNYRGIVYSEQENLILKRITAVFEQTYSRFLDLKKAEAQARESQIELSLERIRSQATAMKVSTDLLDIVVTMRTEFVGLGHEAHYFWHMRYLPDIYEKAMTSGDGTKIGMVMNLPRHMHGDIKLLDQWEKGSDPTVVYAMDTESAIDYIHKMVSLGDFKQVDPNAPSDDDIRHIGGLTFIMARTTHGEIGYSLPGVVPNPPAEDLAVLVRFAGVFDLAYRRFEDLQIAEAQAKAAIKQSSLDRVRAEIASMRKTKDLERITPLLWKELGILGVPFFRCGVFIVNEQEEMVHAYLSNPSGASLAALHLRFDDPDIALVGATIKHWKLQKPYLEEWTQAQFIKSTQLFLKKGQIQDSSKFQASEEPPEKLVLQLVPFKQGMLYAGSETPLIEEHIALMKDLADAFAVAYARYEDFVKLEEAKKKVENALTDLKSAQTQLVHAEKMASLGELTAGIAHEIQNPLNFVNNFSELNKELIQELLEELANGDLEEVSAITKDIIANEEKISHHGKRAEGIVKGMLQHSRANSGEKEPTDINLLADEYLRLSYHGLRAKDKSFNADYETNFDEKLPRINVISQDIGRVLLNLINNAFHACTEQRERASAERSVSNYLPLVSVSTKLNGTKVEICVSDNGAGIPEDIKDKIFQPFFTTKPTGEGTGLGLSLSYDIVTKGHGGELHVETAINEGSKFIIKLPTI